MSVLFDQLESRLLFVAAPPSSFEQYWIELVNRARANPVLEAQRYAIDLNEGLNPNTITNAAKPPLALNAFLVDSAGLTAPQTVFTAPRHHSNWVRLNEQVSLVGANGTLPIDRMIAAGYVFTGTAQGNAESVSALVNPTQPLDIAAVDEIHRRFFVDSGVANRTNRVLMLGLNYREIGPGLDQGAWTPTGQPAQQAVAAVMDFALSTENPGGDAFLTGVAYNDADGNDFYTPNAGTGEGLNNVTITARRLSDGATFTTTTFPSGGYSLRLSPGTYDVIATGGGLGAGNAVSYPAVVVGSQNVKRDFTSQQVVAAPVNPGTVGPTTPNPVTLKGDIKGKVRWDNAGKGIQRDVTFNDVVVGTIVYVDIDNNGARGSTEPFGKVLPNTNGVANGVYNITGINPGVYNIRVEDPSGFRVSIPRDTVNKVTITSGKVTKPRAFVLTDHTLVSGKVYKDLNFNGNFDKDFDKGLKEWRVFIDLNNDSIWQRETEPAVRSESDGYYAFRDLLVGTYTIRVIPKAGFVQTEPTNNGAHVVSVVTTGVDVIERDFGQRAVGGSVTPTPVVTIPNAGFETPSVGNNFVYGPSGASWTFAGAAGLTGNSSSFTSGNPVAPEGVQVALLQFANASFSQTVSGFSAGSYRITFNAAQRANFGGTQDLQILVDGNVVGTITPSSTSYLSYTTSAFSVTAGAHTILFRSLNTAGGDNTAFIDNILIVAA